MSESWAISRSIGPVVRRTLWGGGYRYVVTVELGHHGTLEVEGPREDREGVMDRALLIAAAPHMLEALENLENDNGAIPNHAWNMVQDAITRARGFTDDG